MGKRGWKRTGVTVTLCDYISWTLSPGGPTGALGSLLLHAVGARVSLQHVGTEAAGAMLAPVRAQGMQVPVCCHACRHGARGPCCPPCHVPCRICIPAPWDLKESSESRASRKQRAIYDGWAEYGCAAV